jgi:hypothetical protein
MTLKRMLLWMPLVAGCHLGEVVVNPAARPIQVGFATPSPGCRNLGPVIGSTSGGTGTPTDEHIERALDDARNKAAALGANYLQTQPPQLKNTQYGVMGATVMAIGYWCPPETPEAVAYARVRQQVEAHDAIEKVRPASVDADELRVVRELPSEGCTVIGEQSVTVADRSLVHAVTDLRKKAIEQRANTVLLAPYDESAPQLTVHGKYFACKR